MFTKINIHGKLMCAEKTGGFNLVNGFVAQIKFELGFSLMPYLSKNTLSRWRTQMSETV